MIKSKPIQFLGLILLLTVCQNAIAQNFSKLYDYNSSDDFGNHIFLKSDSSYFLINASAIPNSSISTMTISKDGTTLLNSGHFNINNADCYSNSRGRAKQIKRGKYIIPLTVAWSRPLPLGFTGSSGIAILDSNYNLLHQKLYTIDTNIASENDYDVDELDNGDLLIVGSRTDITNTSYACDGLLIRTDSTGNLIWKKTYTVHGYFRSKFNSIQDVAPDRILVGAHAEYKVYKGSQLYYIRHNPCFILMDTAGNIIKDKIYTTGYNGDITVGAGNIFKDANGGYFHFGRLDTILYEPDPEANVNFPFYLAHLDEDFNFTWTCPFKFNMWKGQKAVWNSIQTHDGSYIVMCSATDNMINNARVWGWAAKVNRNGFIEWDHMYVPDSNYDSYLTDAVELNDGSIVFSGEANSSVYPALRKQDVWLLKVDSNGCEIPGCAPTHINPSTTITKNITIYPNPTTDEIHIDGIADSTMMLLYDVLGREMYKGVSEHSIETLHIAHIPSGNYVLVLRTKEGISIRQKIVKE